MLQSPTSFDGIFNAATKVSDQFALSAFGIAAVVVLVWIVIRSRKSARVPTAAWLILFFAITVPGVGALARTLIDTFEESEVTGDIVDISGEPLRDVLVWVDQNQFPSDINGFYRIIIPRKYRAIGSFTIHAKLLGYHTVRKDVSVHTRSLPLTMARVDDSLPSALNNGTVSGSNVKLNDNHNQNEPSKDPSKAGTEPGAEALAEGARYWMGVGVPLDYKKAMDAFTRAAQEGNSGAYGAIGWMYENGLGVPSDCVQAKSWYDKGFSKGSINTSWNIGRLYDIGCGVSQDQETAIIWYERAAQNGLPEARRDLKKLGVTSP